MTQLAPTPQDDDQHLALVAYLHDRDEPCPACKYNLRNLTSTLCPECGNALRIGVTLADPYLKAWIALIVALLPPASFGGVYMGLFFYLLIYERGFTIGRIFNNVPISVVIIMTHLVLAVPLAIWSLVQRRKFMKLDRTRQRFLAGLAWGAWGVSILCIIILVNE